MSDHGVRHSAGDGLVTGDAVVVDLRLAKVPSRSLAFLIDITLQLLALGALVFLLGVVASVADDVLALVFIFVATLAVFVGYPATMETLTRGRTVGKLALGLRAVRSDGGAIRFRHALVRALVAVVEIYLCFGAIAVITSLLSPEGKRVGDYLAGTVVVRERAPQTSSAPLWLPTSLQPWAATLDLVRLQPATALSARQFLARASTLTAAARTSIGHSLASEIASQVSPPPPTGVSAELFITVVLAERGRRAQAGQSVSTSWPATPSAAGAPDGSDTNGEFTAPA
ncbi:MAG: RDD family protein [Actinomycetia bacterium]|nr:RDD family protein [Actinomycetes bacterium]